MCSVVPGVCVGHSINVVCVISICCVICVGVVPVVYVCVCGVRSVVVFLYLQNEQYALCLAVCVRGVRERDTNQQDPLIQDIMGCAKVTSEVLVLRFRSSTFRDTWKWAQIRREMGQEEWESGASISFFY